MSSNNHALIRYRTIDRCLKSQSKNYFLKDLIKECSDAVHEYEEHRSGKKKQYKSISRRSLMYDLKFMKDEEYGFGAPIDHDRDEGYYYTDPSFEAFQAKISRSDTEKLGDALVMLKQLSGDRNFKHLESLVTRLESTYQIKQTRRKKPIVHFENSTNIEGQRWVTQLMDMIKEKQVLRVHYQPFEQELYHRTISPYILKEYNNRWFLIGYDHDNNLLTNLGLDRIHTINKSLVEYYTDPNFDAVSYAKDIVGVSLSAKEKKVKIKIKAHGKQKYYLDTKPIHSSQKMIKDTDEYGVFQLDLIPNFELQSRILSNIDSLEVMSPKSLKVKLKERLGKANSIYA